MHTWNVFENPQEFVEAFDVVYVRLITFIIKKNDPEPVLSNLQKLLEPDGYIQWDGVDSVYYYFKATDSSVKTTSVERLLQQLRGLDDWKSNMVETLEQNGFQDSNLYQFGYHQSVARYWSDMYMSTWEEFAKTVLQRPIEAAQLGAAAMEQVRNGSAIICPKFI